MKEIWTNVIGYGGAYEVSTWGRIRNQGGDILTPYKNENIQHPIVPGDKRQ